MPDITILDPRAEVGVPITPYDLAADLTRPGLRIGLLSNTFFDATRLLQAVGDVLLETLPTAKITVYESPNASLTSSPELIAQVAAENDVAITAMGHCGSCTSSATRDSVALARAGVPTCALMTEKFWLAGGFVARSVGMPDVPRVKLPHPVAGTGAARLAEIARYAAPFVMEAWAAQGASAERANAA